MKAALWRALDKRLSASYRRLPQLDRAAVRQHPDIQVYEYGETEILDYPRPIEAEIPHEIGRNIGRQVFPRPFVLEIQQARLQGRHAVVLTADKQIVLESLLNHAPYVELASFSPLHYPQTFAQFKRQIQPIHYARLAPLVNLFSAGYYHFLLESLPRLSILAEHQTALGLEIPLLTDPNPPQWLIDGLALAGVQNYIHWEARQARVDHLTLPSLPLGTGIPSPRECRKLSQRLRANLSPQTRRFDSPYIYISRRQATTRRIINEREVLNLLEKYGFQAIELEDLSFSEQVTLFEQAKVIIGAHGAGFANLIHSDHATMLEFFEPSYLNACFYRLASGLGLGYRFMLCEGVGADIKVDIAVLQGILETLF